MNRAALAIIVSACVATGCAVQGQPFLRAELPPDDAVIYVYRPYYYGSSLLRPEVKCGDESAQIGPGGYHAFIVPARRTACSVKTETTDIVEIPAEPRVHYIREEFGWGTLLGHPHLNPVDDDTAQAEIQKCCVMESSTKPKKLQETN